MLKIISVENNIWSVSRSRTVTRSMRQSLDHVRRSRSGTALQQRDNVDELLRGSFAK